jgi:signal transduction protein with GAF and PtsI domain
MKQVSKARELEHRLERLTSELHLLQRISRLMVREVTLADAIRGILTGVSELLSADSCLLYLMDENELVLCAASHSSRGVGTVRLKMSEGLTGWVARERRLLSISREAYRDPRFKAFSDLPEDTYEAFLSAPVVARNRLVGVLNVQHRQAHAHSGEEMELLTTIGEQIGCLILLSQVEPNSVPRIHHAELVLGGSASRTE